MLRFSTGRLLKRPLQYTFATSSAATNICWRGSTHTRTAPRYVRCLTVQASEAPTSITFVGSDDFSIEVLKTMLDAEDIRPAIKVMTVQLTGNTSDPPLLPLQNFARMHGLKVRLYDPIKWKAESADATPMGHEVPPENLKVPPKSDGFLVVASFGHILPPNFLDQWQPSRRLNVHPSVLPRLRGPSPIQTAIYDGHAETGVSIIGVEKRVDTGDIWAQEKIGMYQNDDFKLLRHKLAVIGGRLVNDVIRNMLAGRATSRPQGAGATYTKKVNDSWAKVDWQKTTADKLARMWRSIGHIHPPKSTFIGKGSHERTFRMFEVQTTDAHTPQLTKPGQCTFVDRTSLMHVRCAGDTEATFRYAHTEGSQKTGARQWRNGLPRKIMQFGTHDPSDVPYVVPEYDTVHIHRDGPTPDYARGIPG